ncbi:MAG: LPP20 family lipoprotein [Elusimicrobiales bacterium]|jgi:hypothetical protein|nr:LPP20 family lipoprotein [Elusimicrobiales bacterium]HOL62655.1 LPP20 family lipoprotein [Elusimicrobiales bacterium]HPO95535.1 LPP20 family lipoprotein [Elusimicrobiales bacterium]
MKKIALIAMGLLMTACASNRKYEPQALNLKNAPEWVMKGGEAFKKDSPFIYYGVGISEYIPHTMLMREAADSRGRTEIASQIRTHVEKLYKDYYGNNKDYVDPQKGNVNELIEVARREFVDEVLIGVRIIDRWQDPETKAFYSLAYLNLENNFYDQYKNSLRKTLEEKHYMFVKEKAENMFKEMDSMVEKQRAREKEILGIYDKTTEKKAEADKKS